MHAPNLEMMTAPEALARFLETGDAALLDGVFSDNDVTILENFPPHVFNGQEGLAEWKALMTKHVSVINQLRHTFEPPQDFGLTGDTVHFTLPTRWTGVRDAKPFSELGGWTFVQVREAGGWRIRSYGWAVISFEWLG
ncbi:nuclear transport factor 2 family protein [Caulobacter segnis]